MRFIYLMICFLVSIGLKANDPLVQIPFTIEHEHIYIYVKLNKLDSVHFAFDTGARANLLNTKVAEKLGVEITGRQSVQGVAGVKTMETSDGNSFDFGNLRFRNQRFLMMDLDHMGDEDTQLDGVIGGGIFDNYVVEIDYDQHIIKLYEFEDYKAPVGYKAVEFSLRAFGVPIIPGEVFLPNGNSMEGTFLVDTGASLSFSLNTPFSRENDLYTRLGKTYELRSRALSAENTSTIARLKKANILGQQFENMTVRLAQSNGGVSGNSFVSGIVGLEILKRFNTIYDYYRQTMYIQPSQYLNMDFKINFSGLKVKKENGGLLVEDVFKGSAAEKAQLEVGDLIKSVDGRKNMKKDEFQPYFQNSKEPIRLEILRNGKTRRITIVPEAMI